MSTKLALVSLLVLIAAAPATQPTTRPAAMQLGDALRSVPKEFRPVYKKGTPVNCSPMGNWLLQNYRTKLFSDIVRVEEITVAPSTKGFISVAVKGKLLRPISLWGWRFNVSVNAGQNFPESRLTEWSRVKTGEQLMLTGEWGHLFLDQDLKDDRGVTARFDLDPAKGVEVVSRPN